MRAFFVINNLMTNKSLINVQHTWHDGSHGELIRENTQEITDSFVQELEALKSIQAAKGRIGDMLHVARVPRIIHNKWVAEGFDPSTATEEDFDALMERLREIVKRLRADGQEKFIMTNKTF